MRVRDSILLVALIWSLLPAFGALPLYLHIADLSWTDAYFEAVSGLTATGATVLSGLDQLPMSINFWRTFMHWVGGLGVVVLAVAILPLLGFRRPQHAQGRNAGSDEGCQDHAADHRDRQGSVGGVCDSHRCLCPQPPFVGMEPWDALMHAFSILGLGGFSTKDASLGHFDSLDIEMVVIFFALLAGINFSTHFLVLSKRSLRPIWL
jgi:trk system potassium uptake protein TrkH